MNMWLQIISNDVSQLLPVADVVWKVKEKKKRKLNKKEDDAMSDIKREVEKGKLRKWIENITELQP